MSKIKKCVEQVITIEDLDVKIEKTASSPNEILEYLQDNKIAGLYFLDIDLCADMTGIELAEKIRAYDPRGFIVFVTADEYSLPLTMKYRVEALDYVVKGTPGFEKRIAECIIDAYKKYSTAATPLQQKFPIKVSKHTTVVIDCDDILYFRNSPIHTHNVILVTHNDRYEFRENLSRIEQQLDSTFYRCHRTFIVNLAKITMIDSEKYELVLIGGERVGVSARHVKKIALLLQKLSGLSGLSGGRFS
ncbi:MAG: LytTR family DNA-binding domain-containing protein [Oscillospiraceae bacterium]|nr:LytTR family DNA-binding domain-containing protein [Oscillospiraceae bacterium]